MITESDATEAYTRAQQTARTVSSYGVSPGSLPYGESLSSKKAYFSWLASQGFTIYADDFSRVLLAPAPGSVVRKQALLVLGGEEEDPGFFRRMSGEMLLSLQVAGYDVSVLAVSSGDYGAEKAAGVRRRLQSAVSLLTQIDLLAVFAHGTNDLNLTDKCEISPQEHKTIFSQGAYTGEFRGYYVTCEPETRAQALADAIGHTVLGPAPGMVVAEDPLPTRQRPLFYHHIPVAMRPDDTRLSFWWRNLRRKLKQYSRAIEEPWHSYEPAP